MFLFNHFISPLFYICIYLSFFIFAKLRNRPDNKVSQSFHNNPSCWDLNSYFSTKDYLYIIPYIHTHTNVHMRTAYVNMVKMCRYSLIGQKTENKHRALSRRTWTYFGVTDSHPSFTSIFNLVHLFNGSSNSNA